MEATMSDTHAIQFELPNQTYLALKQAAQKNHRPESELLIEAVQQYLEQLAKIDPLLGLFADDAELIDRVSADALRNRETLPLRSSR
jgi:hypothetical protein